MKSLSPCLQCSKKLVDMIKEIWEKVKLVTIIPNVPHYTFRRKRKRDGTIFG
jgi:hypothetical protein